MTNQTSERTKLNIMVRSDAWTEFLDRAQELNIRRDAYLEDQLLHAIKRHEKLPDTSAPKGAKLTNLMRSMANEQLERVRLTVQKSTIDRLNQLCQSKNLNRDDFVERVIGHASEHLLGVSVVFCNLDAHVDQDHFEDLYWSDADVQNVVDGVLKEDKEAAK